MRARVGAWFKLQVEFLEELELADLLGQAREPIEVEVEPLEVGEPPCRVCTRLGSGLG